MNSSIIADVAIGLVGLLPTLLITVACVIYLQKAKNAASILLLIGNLLAVLCQLSSIVFIAAWRCGSYDFSMFNIYLTVARILSFVAWSAFAVGFLLMALAARRKSMPPIPMQ